MATEYRKILHFSAAVESTTIAEARRWFHAEDTGRLVITRQDGVTRDYFWNTNSLASTSGALGAALIGQAGITGITPNGGSSGSAATVANMLIGVRDSVILKSPYTVGGNIIQPTTANYVPLILKGFTAQAVDLFQVRDSTDTTISRFDSTGNFYVSRSVAGQLVTITIQNTNNTNTGSGSTLFIGVGGSSAGNAWIRYNVNGVKDWSAGVDVQDGNKYKVSESGALGTSDAFLIAPGGSITLNRGVVAGFTMSVSGLLTGLNGMVLDGAGAASRTITFKKSGSARWDILANGDAESGSNAGTTLQVIAYDDTGVAIDSPFSINRSTTGFNIISLNRRVALNAPYYGASRILYTDGGTAIASSSNLTFDGTTATFAAAPVFSSVTASQILAVNGSKALVSLSSTGTGSVVLSVSPTLVSPVLNGTIGTALSFSSTVVTDGSGNLSTVGTTGSGVYVRATAPTIATSLNLSYATASTAAAFDASKNLVSVTNTGTGNNVLSASPTFTGTITAAAISAAGNLSVSRAQVGGSVQSITQNTDNGNTASHAISVVQVGGTTAGDPYQTFLIPGGTIWSHGTDSSDSQSYKVSRNPTLGTNDALVISPALLATFGGSVSCGGGNGTYFQLPRGTSNPSSPAQGFLYENTADGHLYRYNGSAWTQLA